MNFWRIWEGSITFTPFISSSTEALRVFPVYFSLSLLLFAGNIYLSLHTAGRTGGDVTDIVLSVFLWCSVMYHICMQSFSSPCGQLPDVAFINFSCSGERGRSLWVPSSPHLYTIVQMPSSLNILLSSSHCNSLYLRFQLALHPSCKTCQLGSLVLTSVLGLRIYSYLFSKVLIGIYMKYAISC